MNFFDDLNKLNKDLDDGFKEINSHVYDEHDIILSPDKNPEFFESLCNMCEDNFPYLPSNKNGFTQEDLNKITYIKTNKYFDTFFEDVTSLNELQYFHNLEKIHNFSFYQCTKLKSVIFPKNLQIINTCSSLKKIVIPEKFKDNMKNIFDKVDLSKVDITYI